MEIKNENKKLLFNDFEGEEDKKPSSELDFYVKYKDLGLDNEKQYYCYFYEKPDTDKDFVFNKGHVPEMRKNVFDAYNVKYCCNKNCVGLRFFVVDQEIGNNVAENMSPKKNNNITWYEVKQDENGKKYIAKYNWDEKKWEKTNISFAYSNDHFSKKKRWKIGPQEKYGEDKFLVHFNECCDIRVRSNKSNIEQMISKDINSQIDINNLNDDIKIYGCMQLKPDGKFYFDWNKKTLKEKLEEDTGTGNSHDDYMEDVFAMRFYITKQDVNFNVGNEVHNDTFSDPVSVFEYRRNENNDIVLWHLKDKEKNEWEAVDGEIRYKKIVPDYLAPGGGYCLISRLSYFCKTQLTNDIQTSYTVTCDNGKKLLFNDFEEEEEEDKKPSSKLDFYVKYKDLGLDNEKQYYCYFYEQQSGEENFVFNADHDPKIQKNVFGAYDVNYSCNKNCVGLRFFCCDSKIENNVAKNMSPEKNKDVTWYEVKQDEEGKKYIAKYNWDEKKWEKTNISFAYSDDYLSNKKRWKIGPYEKYGDHKFLTHFNNYSQVYIKCDKFKQLISNDINSLKFDADNTEFNPNVYACVKLHPGGDFYLDWSGNMKEDLEKDSGTANNHNGYMEDMYILRFYVTNKKLDINEGDKFDENILFDKNDKISAFEVRRDKSDNVVLWHLKNKEKGEWEVVDGKVRFLLFNEQKTLVDSLSYNCKIQSENGIQKFYTVEILDILDDSKKIGENTVNINNTDIVGQTFNLEKTKTDKCKVKTGESKTKVKSNYHIGKIILFSLFAILVGFLFGWIYALISAFALIVSIILDHKFDFCPEVETIFCCFKSCLGSCCNELDSEEPEPKLGRDIKNRTNNFE